MLEILAWEDIEKVEDKAVKQYLYDTRERAEKEQAPWNFEEWGYWVVMEECKELEQTIIGKYFLLPSLKEGLLNQVEVVEEKFGVYEILILSANDFGIGLLVKKEVLCKNCIENFEKYTRSTREWV